MTSNTLYLNLIFLAAFIFIFQLNPLYKEPLYDYSLIVISGLHGQLDETILTVSQFMSILGDGPFYFLIFIVLLN